MDYSQALKRIITKTDTPYSGIRKLIIDIQSTFDTKLFFVSASYKFLYNCNKWLDRYSISHDGCYQRKSTASKYDYKFITIMEILFENYQKGDEIIFFGDNNGADSLVYSDISRFYKNSKIFIRDVLGLYTIPVFDMNPEKNVNYFLTLLDIRDHFQESFYKTFEEIRYFMKSDLLPFYTRTHQETYLSTENCVNLDQACVDKTTSFVKDYTHLYLENLHRH